MEVRHVEKLNNTDALKQLEADTVTFSHVNFPVGAKFHPFSIRKRLKVIKSTLIGVSINLNSQPSTTAPTVSIRKSVLDRVSFKIKAATFLMIGNRFVQLPPLAAGPMDVVYSRRFHLRNNQFGTTSNAITLLPNVWSSGQSIVLQSKDKILPINSQRWLGHFNFEFTGRVMHGISGTDCKQHKNNDYYTTSCPNVRTYLKLLSTWEDKSATTTRKSHNERLVQGKSDASVAKQNWKLSLISILFILMLRFTTNRF